MPPPLARHLAVENGRVRYAARPEPYTSPHWVAWRSTSFAALAAALNISERQLAHEAELDLLDHQFTELARRTADFEIRTIRSRRLMAHDPSAMPLDHDGDLGPGLWQPGREVVFRSEYWNSVQDYLGPERGFLTPAEMRRLKAFDALEQSIVDDLTKRRKLVNRSYDPLRALALSVGKLAAQEVVDIALSLGMPADHSRLSMLRFNLAL